MIPASIFIRQMTLEDIDAVVSIDQKSFPTPWPRRSFVFEVAENQASHCWVAEWQDDGEALLVGAAVIWLLADQAHIATLAVEAAHRRKGIATQMIGQALTELIDLGASSATLEVRPSNLGAQKLYQQFGFEVVARRPHYYHDNGEDALLMTLAVLDRQSLLAADSPY